MACRWICLCFVLELIVNFSVADLEYFFLPFVSIVSQLIKTKIKPQQLWCYLYPIWRTQISPQIKIEIWKLKLQKYSFFQEFIPDAIEVQNKTLTL